MEQDIKKKKRKYQQSSNIKKRNVRLTIRFTDAEYLEIERAFKDANFKRISDYIRYKLLVGGELSTTKNKQEFYEKLIFEINKIGVNVNQITKVINQNRGYAGDSNIQLLDSYLEKLLVKLDVILDS